MSLSANGKIGFLGAGRMAAALGQGFISQEAISASRLSAFDVAPKACEAFQKQTGASIKSSEAELVQQADVIFLAVKPQVLPEVAACIAKSLTSNHLVVSIAAGITLEQLTGYLAGHESIIRVMPNTPALVGAGAAGMSCSAAVTAEQSDSVLNLMRTVGICFEVTEPLLDAVTGLSGSGPAYVFQIIEALSDAGVKEGLARPIATELAAQTLLGAAKMVLETGEHPGALKDAVTSPAGTTIAAIAAMERRGVRAGLIDAVEAAAKRSRELSQN